MLSRSSSHCCCAAAATAGPVLSPQLIPSCYNVLVPLPGSPPKNLTQKIVPVSLFVASSKLAALLYMPVSHIRERSHQRSPGCSLLYFFGNLLLEPSPFLPPLRCFSVPVSRPSLNAFQVDKLLLSLTSLCWCVCVLRSASLLIPFFLGRKCFHFAVFSASFEFWGGWRKGGRGTHCYEAVLARRFWEHWIDLHTLPPAACVSVILSDVVEDEGDLEFEF